MLGTFIAAVACVDAPATAPRSIVHSNFPVAHASWIDGTDFDPSSPALPDMEEAIDDGITSYSCPRLINGAMIPGNIYPFHVTYVGRYNEFLTRLAIIGSSTFGIPKGRYLVPPGPWNSEDGRVLIMSGTVEGWCKYLPTRARVAFGSLHVTKFDGVVEHLNPPTEEPPVDPCDDPLTDEVETECSEGGGGAPGTGGIGMPINVSGPPVSGSKWVCQVTDWYESTNGGEWVYVETTIDFCWLEAA